MDEEEARRRLSRISPETWQGKTIKLEERDGDTVVCLEEAPHRGVRFFKNDEGHVEFGGALGKLIPQLGLPATNERLLGSIRQGRYQRFEQGLGTWENIHPFGDVGFPIATWPSPTERAASCEAMVAFFDLRGFTTWAGAKGRAASDVQQQIEALEEAFQQSFSGEAQVFAKSTGDGLMIVTEASWFDGSESIVPRHATHFCSACADTLRVARKEIIAELAIGCGITTGTITRLHLLGRLDYIGAPVNDASKIQGAAYDELILADEVVALLRADGWAYKGKYLPGKGLRTEPSALPREVT